MEPIFNISLNGVYAPSPAAQKETHSEQQPEPKPSNALRDTYSPQEQPEPSGRYQIGRDETGQPKIYFDNPAQAENIPQKPDDASDAEPDQGAEKLEKKNADKKAERCIGNTDKVDREIERLKKKRATLEQQLSTETEEGKIKQLEQQLAQVERELRQKDNDTYRRQHTVFS